ncbi:MAG: hypothetical protein ACR2GB_00780 [Nocardioidaceae bacterium]
MVTTIRVRYDPRPLIEATVQQNPPRGSRARLTTYLLVFGPCHSGWRYQPLVVRHLDAYYCLYGPLLGTNDLACCPES